MYTYLILNIATFLFPAIQSFEKRIAFYRKWKFAFPAIAVVGLGFILWDHFFTQAGVWGFNADYHIGFLIGELPLEECLFFLTVPFACLFIFEVLKIVPGIDKWEKAARVFWLVILLGLIVGMFFAEGQAYTLVSFGLAVITLVFHLFILRSKYLGRFTLAYLIHLIPFGIVNGVLTSLPVVWYNPSEFFGVRLGTIPAEDAIYSLSLFLLNVTIYEALQVYWSKKSETKILSEVEKPLEYIN